MGSGMIEEEEGERVTHYTWKTNEKWRKIRILA
jgi:hypothetical protein